MQTLSVRVCLPNLDAVKTKEGNKTSSDLPNYYINPEFICLCLFMFCICVN